MEFQHKGQATQLWGLKMKETTVTNESKVLREFKKQNKWLLLKISQCSTNKPTIHLHGLLLELLVQFNSFLISQRDYH